ncbi:S1C family serine protease [Jeotgalibacillus soli]|uniref:Serine protease n=1 Tax=Jeotgalibacillus soli TaxID=889306 RepID=A0A0C2W662_9BACL|nr:S1C family serine protease [Jeotgalibacillus soli]KIL52056.1 hypothetical protein KP78_04260 [Jeotgalibacillus soli]
MKKSWMICSFFSALLIISTIIGVFYIHDHVAGGITQEKSYLLSEELDSQQQQFIQQMKMSRDEAVYDAQKKVVQIETLSGSIGSGFLYNANGDIVTNAHVVANAAEVTVITADSGRFKGAVIGISDTTDVAVVRVEELAGMEPLVVERDQRAKLSDPVLALGSPLGFQNTVTVGEVNGVDRHFVIEPFTYENIDQITASISPGNSGGPLLHADTMRVIGINSAEDPEMNLGFSIPIMDVVDMIQSWVDSPLESLPAFDQYAKQPEESAVPSREELALYVVQYYFDSLQFGDYVTAYSLMGSEFQEETSYEAYRESFRNIPSISMDNPEILVVSDQVEINVTVHMEELIEHMRLNQTYTFTFVIGEENDRLKIIGMTRQSA